MINQIKFKTFTNKIAAHSPEIFASCAIGAMIGGVITASIATLKAKPILEDHKDKLTAIKTVKETADNLPDMEPYSDEEYAKDKKEIYLDTGKQIAKVYALPACLVCLSAVSTCVSVGILKKRNAAMAAAYLALNQSINEYRNRVKKYYGEEGERKIILGEEENIIEQDYIADNGKKKKKTKKEKVYSPLKSDAIISTLCWENEDFDFTTNFGERQLDNELAMCHLRQLEGMFTNELQSKGFLFLNDVLRALSPSNNKEKYTAVEGQFYGWTYDKDDPDDSGIVDFGIFKDRVNLEKFLTNKYDHLWLKFNIDDGPIISLLNECKTND